MPDLGVSASVTAYGRDMIQLCETVIAEHYPGSVTIYGDTDSVMVKFAGVTDMETAIARGKEAAALLTERFQPPIRLEFEKVFWPFLSISYVWVFVHVCVHGFDVREKVAKRHISLGTVARPATRNTIANFVILRRIYSINADGGHSSTIRTTSLK